MQQTSQAGQLINNQTVVQQQGHNIGLIQNSQIMNQNQIADQKDLRHLLVNQNQQILQQPNINQIQQQPQQLQAPNTSQSWINVNQQQGNVQQLQQQQQQQIYINNQSGMPQQQKNQSQNFQYYQ